MQQMKNSKRLIAIIGAQGTGKTTLIDKVKNRMLSGGNCKFLMVREVARQCPYSIGNKSDEKAQTWIFRTQCIVESFVRSLALPTLLDRSVLDQYAYYRYWNGKNAVAEQEISSALMYYRAIFFLTPNPKYLVEDGVRPLDSNHQLEIDTLISENVANLVRGTPIFRISSDTESTLAQIVSLLQDIQKDMISANFEAFQTDHQFGSLVIPPFSKNHIIDLLTHLIVPVPNLSVSAIIKENLQ
jgi:predicted ATPase